MGEPSTRHAPATSPPDSRGRGWLAAVPFALAWVVAAAVLNGALAPRSQGGRGHGPLGPDAPELEHAPPPPPATHHDEIVFDESELITV
jgi:hypothetical protein